MFCIIVDFDKAHFETHFENLKTVANVISLLPSVPILQNVIRKSEQVYFKERLSSRQRSVTDCGKYNLMARYKLLVFIFTSARNTFVRRTSRIL